MKLLSIIRRAPNATAAARAMRMAGVDKRRALVRANVDDMRARMGMPTARWPQ
jgi:hypothetical protein